LSFIMLIIPIAALLKPNGSAEPVGIFSRAKTPLMVSILSAILTICPVNAWGSSPSEEIGK